MVAYLDSSLALRYLFLGEKTIQHALALDRVVSSELLEIECRRVIQRNRLAGKLDDLSQAKAFDMLDGLLASLYLIELSSAIKRRAMGAFPTTVDTLDAIHLASALVLADREPEETLLFFSHDASMNRCARALGFGAPLYVA